MSGKQEKKNDDVGGQTLRDSTGKAEDRLTFDQVHYVNTSLKEMFLCFILFIFFCLCVLKKKYRYICIVGSLAGLSAKQ